MTNARAFRTPESHSEEQATRQMLGSYLRNRGFRDIEDNRRLYGTAESQTIRAVAPDGETVVLRVRLCWRKDRGVPGGKQYSAAQLMARITAGDWEGSVKRKIANQKEEGVTHLLIVQREGDAITRAALVPLSAVFNIWCAQRDVSSALIQRGELGRRTKNHAMNGASPTLWLFDESAPAVGNELWGHPGVVDLERIDPGVRARQPLDDTFDDLPGVDENLLGSDGAPVKSTQRSLVARDGRVRAAVLRRAAGMCERKGCRAIRTYPGFLDVHHIFGAAKSDRVNNCVAVCPNCHREAHYAPDRDEINAALLGVARRASSRGGSGKRPVVKA